MHGINTKEVRRRQNIFNKTTPESEFGIGHPSGCYRPYSYERGSDVSCDRTVNSKEMALVRKAVRDSIIGRTDSRVNLTYS